MTAVFNYVYYWDVILDHEVVDLIGNATAVTLRATVHVIPSACIELVEGSDIHVSV